MSLDDSVTIDFVEVDAGPADGMLRHVRFRSEGGERSGHVRRWTAVRANPGDALG